MEAQAYKALLDWLERAKGCPESLAAAAELARILDRSLGALRVAACTTKEPIPLPVLGEGYVAVGASWPVLSVAVDVVLVGWGNAPVDASARARMRSPDACFRLVDDQWLQGASAAKVRACVESIDLAEVRRARHFRLRGEVEALRRRFPSAGLPAVEPPAGAAALRLALVGPEPAERERWRARMCELGELVAPTSPVDVVVAVAPPAGWDPSHRGVLEEAARRCGCLVVTAPIPHSWRVPALLVDEKRTSGGLREVVHRALGRTSEAGRTATVDRLARGQARERMLVRRQRRIRELSYASLRRLARELGVAATVSGPLVVAEAAVMGVLIVGGLLRAGVWPPVAAGMGTGLAVGRVALVRRARLKELRQEVSSEMVLLR